MVVLSYLHWPARYGPADRAQRSAAPPQVAPRARFQTKVLAKIYEAKSVFFKGPGLDLVLPPLYISPPGHAQSAGPALRRASKLVFAFFSQFFRLQKRSSKMTSKKIRKSRILASKILPKSFQNASEIDVPKNMRFFIDFWSIFFFFSIFDFLKMCVFPRENRYFHSFR